MEREPGKRDDLINSISKFEEKCHEERVMDFGNFLGELKREPIDYEWANDEAQCEETDNESKKHLKALEKRPKEKVQQRRATVSHNLILKKFLKGKKLYTSGEYKKAKKLFKELAEGGCAEGMHCLAILYNNGEGCKKSIKKASYWATMSIQNGNLVAKHTLDDILYEAELELDEESDEELENCLIF